MKKLLLVRHGKAVNENGNGDFERPLKSSGEEDVLALAKQLKDDGIIPQMVYTSPAKRAKKTAKIITEHLQLPKASKIAEIYEASDGALVAIVNNLSEQYKFVMLAGHNPGFSTIASYLSGEYCELQTSGAVLLEFDIEHWAEISGGTAKIAWKYND